MGKKYSLDKLTELYVNESVRFMGSFAGSCSLISLSERYVNFGDEIFIRRAELSHPSS